MAKPDMASQVLVLLQFTTDTRFGTSGNPYLRITSGLPVTSAKSEASSGAPKSWTLAAFT
jgi:hypothetical protein